MYNTLYIGDNLSIMKTLDNESVDLIYVDPPFNSNRVYKGVKGSRADGVSFSDVWGAGNLDKDFLCRLKNKNHPLGDFIESIEHLHSKEMMVYITFMTQRIARMRRILKPTGSFYLHVDPTTSHYLKIVLDSIFGRKNFLNEIVWYYTSGGGRGRRWFNRKHDVLLCYSKSNKYYYNGLDVGDKRTENEGTFSGYFKTDDDGKRYQEVRANGKIYKYYVGDPKNPDDVWQVKNIPQRDTTERTGYPTQKPLALVKRVIKASSSEGDLVLDAFCGSGTTLIAAQQLDRNWIGIDNQKEVSKVVYSRLESKDMATDFICKEGIV